MWNERFGECMDRFMAKASRTDTPDDSGSYKVMFDLDLLFVPGGFLRSVCLCPPVHRPKSCALPRRDLWVDRRRDPPSH
jgi:hypothetical protein